MDMATPRQQHHPRSRSTRRKPLYAAQGNGYGLRYRRNTLYNQKEGIMKSVFLSDKDLAGWIIAVYEGGGEES